MCKKWIEGIKIFENKNFTYLQEFEGKSGKVSLAKWKKYEKIFELKTCSISKLVHELKLHREVDYHDNIIRCYGVTSVEQGNRFNQYSLVFGHADGGTLRELLKDKFQSLKWVDKISLGSQLASSITCLHDEGIVHGDLNSQNILIHQNSIKLVDFGQTKEVSKELSNMPYNDPKLFNRRGNNVSNKKNDVFGVGVLLWEISSGTPPFKDEPYDSYFDFQGRREVPVPGTPEDYKKIYTECWDDETKRRPEMRDVVLKLNNVQIEDHY